MSMFTPFAFYQSEDEWTPEQLGGLEYYWIANHGITLSGANAIAWDSKVGSLTLEDLTSTAPRYNSNVSGWNNRAGLEFNSTSTGDGLQATSGFRVGTDDYPFVWWIAANDSNSDGGYQGIGGDNKSSANQELFLESNHPSQANAWSIYTYKIKTGGGATDLNVGGAISSFKGWVGASVDNSAGTGHVWVNGTENSAFTSLTNDWGVSFDIVLTCGNYGDGQTIGYKGTIFEMGFMTSEPTSDEISKMETYINTYYGVTYST